ncbi:MAG: Ig-like domain-containing protein, partial [Waddliaceae bacterium]
TPNIGFTGTDSFTYHANDGVLNSNIATVTITVNAIGGNEAPTAVDDNYNHNINCHGGNSHCGNGHDDDHDGNNDDDHDNNNDDNRDREEDWEGSWDDDDWGNDWYDDYNDHDSYSVPTNQPLIINAVNGVLANDIDPEGQTLTAILITTTTNGTLTLNPDGSFEYTPHAGFSGVDTFTYKANDGELDSNAATVTITVNFNPNLYLRGSDHRVYIENHNPRILAPSVKVADCDSTDFDGGILTVDITENGTANDRLIIKSSHKVTTSGSNIFYRGTLIGTFMGGNGLTPLGITFNANADQRAVEETTEQIAFYNVSDNPSTLNRQVRFVLSDGDSGTSHEQFKTVRVFSVNDAPDINATSDNLTLDSGTVENVGAQSGISISDVDYQAGDLMKVVLKVRRGLLNFTDDLSDLTSLEFKKDPGVSGLKKLKFTGTLDDINAALTRLTYISKPGYTGGDVLKIRISDYGSSGFLGGTQYDREKIELWII